MREPDPIAVEAATASGMFGMSVKSWNRMNREEQIPAPRKMRGMFRWDVAELRAWTAAGCPVRADWTYRPNGSTKSSKSRRVR